jgi:hypothetical protein
MGFREYTFFAEVTCTIQYKHSIEGKIVFSVLLQYCDTMYYDARNLDLQQRPIVR